jgi:hypothetical protein
MDSSNSLNDSSPLSNKTVKNSPISNASQSQIAQKTWELSNSIQGLCYSIIYIIYFLFLFQSKILIKKEIHSVEELYKFDEIAHRNLLSNYFIITSLIVISNKRCLSQCMSEKLENYVQ